MATAVRALLGLACALLLALPAAVQAALPARTSPPLSVPLQTALETVHPPQAVELQAQPTASSVSRRSNMDGYRLSSWSYRSTPEGAELDLIYRPISWASLVKWLLPLTITMVVMLLTPNLRSSFSSERLAIPPVILLTLVFMQQAYRDTLPSLPYLTVLDGLYAFSYLVTLAFFCEFIWCANLMDGRSSSAIARLEPRVGRLELVLQLVSLGGYAVLLAWAWSQR